MNTVTAETILFEFFDFKNNLVVPRANKPVVDFESDLVVLTNKNYAKVVEIKTSMPDLLSEIKKNHIISIKDPVLFKNYFGKIKYFYYAVPEKMLKKAYEVVPDFAGIINLSTKRLVRKPYMLFEYKWSQKERLILATQGSKKIYHLKLDSIDFDKSHKPSSNRIISRSLKDYKEKVKNEHKIKVLKLRNELKIMKIKKPLEKFLLYHKDTYDTDQKCKRAYNLWYCAITDRQFTEQLEAFVNHKQKEKQ